MKRAQIKMFETVGVLVVFFFLLAIGVVFYFNAQESAMEQELKKQILMRSLQSAQSATFLPELDCSFVTVTRENCFDLKKLEVFPNLVAEREQDYFRMFGYANVTVRKVYPESDDVYELYDKPLDEYTDAIKSLIPVLLYDPVLRSYDFGVIEVTTYAAR